MKTYRKSPDTPLSDTELLSGIKRGDESNFKVLFDRYYRDLVNRSFMLTLDLNASKDVVQDVFIKIWTNKTTLKPDLKVLAYLRTSTVNRSLNFIKSRKLHGGKSDSKNFETIESKENIQENIENKEVNLKINEAIESLPERCRMIFILSKFEGYRHKEIAEIMNISTKTVENQMTKALKTLRKLLSELKGVVTSLVLLALLII